MKKQIFRYVLAWATLLCSSIANSGVTLGGTRLIYPEKLKEVSVMVKNNGVQDIMIQSWIEADFGIQNSDVPFALTPALSRLNGKKQQILRIFYAGEGLPLDKESVFWLNVQEIPQKSGSDNNLQIAVRQRIKVFYRPSGLVGSEEESAKHLKWSLVRERGQVWLWAVNDSAFHVSLSRVVLKLPGKDYLVEADMVAPGDSLKLSVASADHLSTEQNFSIEFEAINDFGASKPYVSGLVKDKK